MAGQEFCFFLPFSFGFFLVEILHAVDVGQIAALFIHEHIGRCCRIHEQILGRIGNGHGQAAGNGHAQEGGVDIDPVRQAEGDVGQAADRGQSQVLLAMVKRGHAVQGRRRRSPDRRYQGVDDDIFRRKAVVVGIGQELVEDGMFFFEGLGDTVIRNRQGDEHGAVLLDDRQEFLSLFRFTGNGIDQGPAGIDAQGRFHDVR